MTYLWQHLKETNKPIVLYGMGNGADRLLDYLANLSIPVSGVFASDEFVRGHSFRGFEVTNYTTAKERFGDMIVLLAFGTQLPDVMERIMRIASEQELYAPDMPVYGDTFFTPEYAAEHKEELFRVREMLSDDTSRHVFDSIINYRLTGSLSYLTDCETPVDEAYENILKLTDTETYLDLGAYNGDTVAEFLSHVDHYKKIIAVEPDPRSFRKLTQNTEGLKNFTSHNLGISEGAEFIPFSSGAGRGSASAGKMNKMFPSSSVDNLLAGEKVTYIKMDVEGQERAAIIGAEKTIKQHHPKMLVSCYHRTEDIFDLPLLVQSITPGYKVYIRHHPYFPAWDTNFYFI